MIPQSFEDGLINVMILTVIAFMAGMAGTFLYAVGEVIIQWAM